MSQSIDHVNQKTDLIITVLYDNNSFIKNLRTDWGFACLVEYEDKGILFDTGGDGDLLLENIEKLNINPQDIDMIFLSHFHHDHTGGMEKILKEINRPKIYYPYSFPESLIRSMKSSGAELFPVEGFQELEKNIFSLGTLNGSVPEQSLAVRTSKGIIVITGCAHPGIVRILEKAKDTFPEDPFYLVIGGFHLIRESQSQLKSIANELLNMNILHVAPCHCSGDPARKIFRDIFGENFIEAGVGKVIQIEY